MKNLKIGDGRCACRECGECFNSTAAFDKHRVGRHGVDRRCLDADGMQAKGMSENAGGYWVTEALPDAVWSDDHLSVSGENQKQVLGPA